MKPNLIILILVIIGLYSCGQIPKQKPNNVSIDFVSIDNLKSREIFNPNSTDPNTFIDTESTYPLSKNQNIIIQNSLPKGGAIYGIHSSLDSNKIAYGYGVFWSRIVNETDKTLEISINFPADSFAIPSSPGSYFKLFLPPDTMNFNKLSSLDYGVKDLKSFINTNFHQPSMVQKMIEPNEEYVFYTTLLIHQPIDGPIRTGFVLKDSALFYRTNIPPFDTDLIPCGQIVF